MSEQIQINQIKHFLSAYPKEIAEAGIRAWQEIGLNIAEGFATETPLAQNYNELTEEAQQFIKEEAEDMSDILPLAVCGRRMSLTGVCGGCSKGKEGFKSKLICSHEEYFHETVAEKISEFKRIKNGL